MKQTPETKKKLPFIEGFFKQTLSQNLTAISGEAVRVEVENLSFENFQTETGKLKAGRFLYVYTETNRAEMIFLLPDTAQLILFKKIKNLDSGEKDDAGLTKLLNRIVGNLPYLCSVKENGLVSNVFALQKPYNSELNDQLLWDVSECNIFRCSAFGAVFYLPLNIELQKSIEKLLQTDPAFKKTLRGLTQNRRVTGESLIALQESDIKLRVKNPFEFIIGSSFLPREAYLGKKDVSVIFNEITAARQPASQMNEGMIWYRFWIITGEKEYSVYYSVDVNGQQKKYSQFFNSLFTEMVKRTASFLRAQSGFDRVKGKIVPTPAEDEIDDTVMLTANINWENRRIKTRIFVPGLFFSDYLSPFLEDWEAEYLKNTEIPILISLLSINAAIFGKNINTFYRKTGPESPKGELYLFGVSKILAILDKNNASRLVQNYFLAGGSSLDEFQSLFLYRYYVEGEEKSKVGRDALFNREEYKKYIPKALHSDWAQCAGTSANYEELAVLNVKALKGIYKAMKEDKLLMPYKVSFILYNEFQKPLDEKFKGEINRLVLLNQWPGLIEKIPKKTGQQAVSAIPSSKLAVALVPGSPTVKDLAHLISKTKRSELEEEIKMNTKKYELGNLPAEKIFLAMKELLVILDKLANPEDDEMI
ncbi:MAG TPA: hypothetical protein DCO79_07840 [Spirochaeta sp.]|nr:hypothetical protein [Spirochaeta sp.]